MQSVLETGLFTLGGVVIGGLVTAFATFRQAHLQRKLELYKIVYPKKFEAAQEIVAAAFTILDALPGGIEGTDKELLKKLSDDLSNL